MPSCKNHEFYITQKSLRIQCNIYEIDFFKMNYVTKSHYCVLLVNYGALMLRALFEHWPQANTSGDEKESGSLSQVMWHAYTPSHNTLHNNTHTHTHPL